MTNRHATAQTGEALIGAELARIGFTIAFPTGNAKAVDILAYRDGESRAVQVKTVSKGSLQIDLGKFVDIEFEGDPGQERQIINGPLKSLDCAIDFVIVFLGSKLGEDEIFCAKLEAFATFASNRQRNYLIDGRRPGTNKKSLHAGYKREIIAADKIFRSFKEYFG